MIFLAVKKINISRSKIKLSDIVKLVQMALVYFSGPEIYIEHTIQNYKKWQNDNITNQDINQGTKYTSINSKYQKLCVFNLRPIKD